MPERERERLLLIWVAQSMQREAQSAPELSSPMTGLSQLLQQLRTAQLEPGVQCGQDQPCGPAPEDPQMTPTWPLQVGAPSCAVSTHSKAAIFQHLQRKKR